MSHGLRRLTSFYTRSFDKRPLITLTVANCVLSGFGDACAQTLPVILGSIDELSWDSARSLRFLTFGAAMAPIMGKWNHFIEHAFPLRIKPKSEVSDELRRKTRDKLVPAVPVDPYSPPPLNRPPAIEDVGLKSEKPAADPASPEPPVSLVQLGKRLGTDQILMAPIGLATFILAMATMEGLDWKDIKKRFAHMYIPVLFINWQVWPFVQLINFRYMSLQYRVPFAASCGILWTIFISYRQAQVKKAEQRHEYKD